MLKKISILAHTQQSYSNAVTQILGKGSEHASMVYEEFFRDGRVQGKHPAFKNAQYLLESIQSLTDFSLPEVVKTCHDGNTGKFLVRIDEKLEAESVMIPMKAGGTLCVSSQVGCRLGCVFCETGRMGLLKNLTAEEIVAQVYLARHEMEFEIRNIVFMGMGEPFDNYENVLQAAKVLQCQRGLSFGRSRISVSTSGCVDGIEKLTREGPHGPNLAVSVNAPNDAIRQKIMPITKKYPMDRLYKAIRSYCDHTGRQVLIAYVLLKGINDHLDHADELAGYLRGLNVKVNLIPYNPQTRDRFQPPDQGVLDAFTELLRHHGYYTLLRTTKGKDIMAACGQLGNLEIRKEIYSKIK